jgi:hypothetical protein
LVKRIGPVVAEFAARVTAERRARRRREAERIAADRDRGYRAGEAWAGSVATRRQLRRLDGPFPVEEASPEDLGPREQLYVWIVGRLDGRNAIKAFWSTAVGDAAAVDNEDFANGFLLGALSWDPTGVARRRRWTRVDQPPGS